jgi:tetratricopeptide (TPR) repeat protein
MTTRALVGVSMPRSGHHFLEKLLRAAYRDRLRYCEFYTPRECCRAVPCQRPADAPLAVIFQKNHDFDLTLPRDLPGVTYAVQFRAPVLAALSDREYLARHHGAEIAGDRSHLVVWLGQRAAYYVRFLRKWVVDPGPQHLTIDYRRLAAEPRQVVEAIARALGTELSGGAIESAIAEVQGTVADFPAPPVETAFAPRDLTRSPYYDETLLSVFESFVVAQVPQLSHLRLLPGSDDADHPVWQVALAELAEAGGDREAARQHIRRAAAGAGDNAYLWYRLAQADVAARDIPSALDAAGRACGLMPEQPEALRLLSELHLRQADAELTLSIAYAERLTAVLPGDAGHAVHLATLLLRARQLGRAADLARRVFAIDPADPGIWREASELLARCDDVPAALRAVDRVIALAPEMAEPHHHRAVLLAGMNRIDEAADSHQRAIDLAPDIVDWRWRYAADLMMAGRIGAAREVVSAGLRRFDGAPQLEALQRQLAGML